MRRVCLFPLVLALLILAAGCSASIPESAATETKSTEEAFSATPSSAEEPAPDPSALPGPIDPQDRELNLLLVGNSFTYYNGLHAPNGILKRMLDSMGYSVKITSVTKGGYYLHQMLDENDPYGKQVLEKLRSETRYDIVIIQDQSANPLLHPGDYYASCRRFDDLVRENGGKLYLYETWGYQKGHAKLKMFGLDSLQMEGKLRAAAFAIGEELGVPVIYAGAAFSRVNSDAPFVNLYADDLKHPSRAGSILVAYTICGSVFGEDPLAVPYTGGLDPDVAAALRAAASAVVKEGAPVDEADRTSSVGVTE